MFYLEAMHDTWQLYHKVTFDGVAKTITVNNGENIIDVRVDIYSDWKEWMQLRDYAKYDFALRSIGGDVIDAQAGLYAGDTYFLMNGWQVVIPHNVKVNGVLYHDDGLDPFIIETGGGVRSTVSNLVQTVVVKETIVAPVATPAEIALAVRAELTPELDIIGSQINGLTPSQATMLSEIYALYGLDPTKPLVVTDTFRTAGAGIHQNINSTPNQTTVTRS